MPETTDADRTLYYAPRTRSFTALWLLEELGLDYRLESFDLNTGRHKREDFLALNPLGKVPVVVDDGVVVSELGAIALYLADRHREAARLAPALDDPQRAAFLRWCFFASAIMEPAYGEKLFRWEVPSRAVAWGSFDQMLATVTAGVSPGPFLLGPGLAACDVLVGSALRFGMLFGVLEKAGPLGDYVARLEAREPFARAAAIEAREGERFPPPPR
ncbi:MAG TPA: glutathione S-transferase [Sandaracinaceae bacterium LLY-WYZ-13_1]|nr:glutathione S-transferase [Sandaracinaceae bacterium LLY-WYZ-13_1]